MGAKIDTKGILDADEIDQAEADDGRLRSRLTCFALLLHPSLGAECRSD